MVVVRESPRAKLSPDKRTTQWPPKSPFQALLSSPSGQRRWKDIRELGRERARSTSPSPQKALSSSKVLQDLAGSDSEEGQEDEETIQLRIAELQAKLKLKKLQAKRAGRGENGIIERTTPSQARSSQRSPERASKRVPTRPSPVREVEVPVSPARDRLLQVHEQPSPARRRLGLESVAKAEHVSLKRSREGAQGTRSNIQRSAKDTEIDQSQRPTSFSARLRESKVESESQLAKAERLEKTRSKGFGAKSTASTLPKASKALAEDSKSVRRSDSERKRTGVRHTQREHGRLNHEQLNSAEKLPHAAQTNPSSLFSGISNVSNAHRRKESQQDAEDSSDSLDIADLPAKSSSGYDSFSQLHLTKRLIPHVDVARALHDKEIYNLPRLLKEVKAPHYDPPDCENDFVVFAVLASKSTPYNQKPAHHTSDQHKPQDDANGPRNKFMVLKLTDLNWEVDCFLFGTAFDQFWKLTPGTLLAILNPAIMPPKTNVHNGKFCLKLGSSEDCVMEIGVARDLGWCNAVKKDGAQCGSWVNTRKTEACDFHINMLIDRARKGRMEVNTMGRVHGDSNRSKDANGGGPRGKAKGERGGYHREYGQLYSVPTGVGQTTANLLDAEDMDTLSNLTAAELSRKRLADKQRERDLRKKLTENSSSLGAEYLRTKDGVTAPNATHSSDGRPYFVKPTANELGLLDRRATDVHLSPAKDRKRHFGTANFKSDTGHGVTAMGWGGARQAGLLQPREGRLRSPEKGQSRLDAHIPPRGTVRPRSQGSAGGSLNVSPKKKARFQLEQGIREPGRESGGNDLSRLEDHDDDDEDGLDIV